MTTAAAPELSSLRKSVYKNGTVPAGACGEHHNRVMFSPGRLVEMPCGLHARALGEEGRARCGRARL